MSKMNKTLEEFEAAKGWSSKLFYTEAHTFVLELAKSGIPVDFGRTVIHIGQTLKAYVHYQGRTSEFATITDRNGVEIESFHFTEFEKLKTLVKQELGLK